MPEFQRPRGTRDFGPEETARRRYVEEKMRETARLFGFGEVMTPTFESTDLFVARSGEGIIDELYAFEDKGGRKISLRPELTAAVMRYYVNEMNSLPKPLKLFYMGNCFRYERPQAGRYREFWQFGAEIIGAESVDSDAEVIAFAYSLARSVDVRCSDIRIGNLQILKAFFDSVGIEEGVQADIRRLLDKKDMPGLDALFTERGLDSNALDNLKKLVNLQGSPDFILDEAAKIVGDCEAIEYLKKLNRRLNAYGIQDSELSLDLGVARGLDYYTGMVFEMDGAGLGAESQICGGGAYTLSEVFGGQPVNSTGFAFGFDRMMMTRNDGDDEIKPLQAYILPIGDGAKTTAIKILSQLRNAKVSADMDLMGRNMSKAMKYADSIGARKVIIIGDMELAEGSVTIRDMKSGQQEKSSVERIKDYL